MPKVQLTGRLRFAACLVTALLALATTPALAQAASTPYCGITWGSMAKTAGAWQSGAVTGVRAGRHACFDRLVLDLTGRAPGYSVSYVAQVTAPGNGRVVPVAGGARLQITALKSATRAPAMPTVTGYSTFRQVSWAGSFEGRTVLALGVRARLPMRAFALYDAATNRSRLVIDVAHFWSTPTTTSAPTLGATARLSEALTAVDLSDDGRYVATGGDVRGLRRYDRTTGDFTLAPADLEEMSGDGRVFVGRGSSADSFRRAALGGTVTTVPTATTPVGWWHEDPHASTDGTVVAFRSTHPGLAQTAAFVYSHATGSLTRLTSGTARNTAGASVSGSGRWVAYEEHELAGCTRCGEIRVLDRTTGTRTLVTVTPTGARSGTGHAFRPVISGDGRHVAFVSTATDLVTGTVGVQPRLYVRDLDAGRTTLVADAPSDPLGRWTIDISADGSRIVYLENAPTRGGGATAPMPQAFLYDRASRTRTLLSGGLGGAMPNGWVGTVQVSANGRVVAFSSSSTNLTAGGQMGVFTRTLG